MKASMRRRARSFPAPGLHAGFDLGAHLRTSHIPQAERAARIVVGDALKMVCVRRGGGDHPIVRGTANFVGNALPAGLEAGALVAAAALGGTAQLVPAIAQAASCRACDSFAFSLPKIDAGSMAGQSRGFYSSSRPSTFTWEYA
jgi:hypothetical protein